MHTYMNVQEAAEFLRLRPSTLYAWVCAGRIPYAKIGSRILFDRNVLVQWVAARARPERSGPRSAAPQPSTARRGTPPSRPVREHVSHGS